MKRILLLAFVCLFFLNGVRAQNMTYEQRLFYTCKVWGFVKYFHSSVNTCKVNWDSVLLATLPQVKTAYNKVSFNQVVLKMIDAAGPMQISHTPFTDTFPQYLKRNRDFGWIKNSYLNDTIQARLDTIQANFRPHYICWAKADSSGTYGDLFFPGDTLMYPYSTYAKFPDEGHRLFIFFKHWNILNYYNPYNYLAAYSMDSIFSLSIDEFLNASDYGSFAEAEYYFTSFLKDETVNQYTNSSIHLKYGYYAPKVEVQYIQGQYIVTKSAVNGINKGDAIVSTHGAYPSDFEQYYKNHFSYSNEASFHTLIASALLSGFYNSKFNIQIRDSTGTVSDVSVTCNTYFLDNFFLAKNEIADSLNAIGWTKLDCNTGYINMENITNSSIGQAYTALKNSQTIIFDMRNSINFSILNLFSLLLPEQITPYYILSSDLSYPGTFKRKDVSIGVPNNSDYFKGHIILLINSSWVNSASKVAARIFSTLPNTIKVGSQTMGSISSPSVFSLSTDISAGLSTRGFFFKNADSMELTGLIPDVTVATTIQGIKSGDDKVLDKAMQLSCSYTSIEKQNDKSALSIYPNPCPEVIHINGIPPNTKAKIQIVDALGRTRIIRYIEGNEYTVDVSSLSPGLYNLVIQFNSTVETHKFIKN
jgi:hypothetical protein